MSDRRSDSATRADDRAPDRRPKVVRPKRCSTASCCTCGATRVRLPDGSLATREYVVHPGRRADRAGAAGRPPRRRAPVPLSGRPRCSSSFRPASSIPAKPPLATAQRELARGGGLRGRDVDAARHDPSGGRLFERGDRPLRRGRTHARRRAARRRRVPRDRHDEPSTRCSRRSIAARSPTPRPSRRCCSTRGAARVDAMIARRLVIRGRVQGVGYRDGDGRGRQRAGRRRLGAQSPRRHGRGAGAGRRRRRSSGCWRGAGAGRRRRASPRSPTRRADVGSRAATRSCAARRNELGFACAPAADRARRHARRRVRDAEDVLPRGVARRGPQRQRQHEPEAHRREPEAEQHQRRRGVDEQRQRVERERVPARRERGAAAARRSSSAWNGTNMTGSDARMPIA